MTRTTPHLLAAAFLFSTAVLRAEPIPPKELEFFEMEVRPILVDHCYKCHSQSAEKIKGGLLLDTRAGLLKGGETGPALDPRYPQQSLLLQSIRHEGDFQMPKEKLGQREIGILTRWVGMGAPDPRDGKLRKSADAINVAKGRAFWAYQPLARTDPPAAKEADWNSNPIDRHLRASLREKGLKPVSKAEPVALLRRLFFDLVGLPPSPAQIDAFVADPSPAAFEKVVNYLLASSHFGERWGRHWLDVARFAESTGMERNFLYPQAWRYRDYVIASFNEDKPYDVFLREQIAGDLLSTKDRAVRDRNLVATGFLAIGPKSLNEQDREQFLMDVVDDQIDTTCRAVLGLTVACARCHDHKFDAIPTEDYYALAGIFRSTNTHFGTSKQGGNRQASDLMAIGEEADARKQELSAFRKRMGSVNGELAKLKKRYQKVLNQNKKKKEHPEVKKAYASMKEAERRIAQLRKSAPEAPEFAMGVKDAGKPADTQLRRRGEPSDRGPRIPRGFLQVVGDHGIGIPGQASGRLEFAEWLVHDDNPLTPRVLANRIWSHLFSEGIVRTVDNFGEMGEKPDHPELLDYLARRLQDDHAWSIKRLVREIVLTRAYQSSSEFHEEAVEVDPDNRLLWRQNARRLDAESLRDALLSASGNLERSPRRESLIRELGDKNIGRDAKTLARLRKEADGAHRSIYLPIVRNEMPEFLNTFDAAQPSLVVGKRDVTTVATQALYLLNSEFAIDRADDLAGRIVKEGGSIDPDRIDFAYKLVLSRSPSPSERVAALSYLKDARKVFADRESPEQASAKAKTPAKPDLSHHHLAWSSLAQALVASAEFRYVQ